MLVGKLAQTIQLTQIHTVAHANISSKACALADIRGQYSLSTRIPHSHHHITAR